MVISRRNLLVLLCCCVLLVAGMGNLAAQVSNLHQPVARFGEVSLFDEDLLPSIGGQLFQLKNQEYELKSAAVINEANLRLLEAEAKKAGLSPEALLDQKVDRNVPRPSTGEIEAYYLAQKDRINKPLNEVSAQIEQALFQARRQAARQAWLTQLREQAGFISLLNRPKVDVTADPSRLKGDPGALITIVEYADFQCPYCIEAQATLKVLVAKYNGKVRLSFRDFPLRQIHPQAQLSAEASRCAGEQGKFWDYHDLLYASRGKLDSASLKDYAHTTGLDGARFDACLASGKFRSLIDSDLQSGTMAGITGTPAFFINGVLLSGAQPLSAFESVIDKELAHVGKSTEGTTNDSR